MFKKNDPLVQSIQKVMEQNERARQIETKLCEELGIYSRKQLPREHLANYDALLEERLAEANDPLESRGGIAAVNRKPRAGRGEDEIAVGNRSDSRRPFTADDTKRVRGQLKDKIKSALGKHTKPKLSEESEGSTPTTPKEKALAKLHGNPNKITHGDVLKGRGVIPEAELAAPEAGPKGPAGSKAVAAVKKVMKEQNIEEAKYSAKAARAGEDIGKPGKNFEKIAKKAGERYGSEERGKKVAGAILAKIRAKHMSEAELSEPETGARKTPGSNQPMCESGEMGPETKKKVEAKLYRHKTSEKEIKTSKNPGPEWELVKEEQISEKAPPGAKFERMVKHIKKGYEKGGLSDKEKSIAYATAWKAKKKEEMKEGLSLDSVMEEIKKKLGAAKMKEIEEEQKGPFDSSDDSSNPFTGSKANDKPPAVSQAKSSSDASEPASSSSTGGSPMPASSTSTPSSVRNSTSSGSDGSSPRSNDGSEPAKSTSATKSTSDDKVNAIIRSPAVTVPGAEQPGVAKPTSAGSERAAAPASDERNKPAPKPAAPTPPQRPTSGPAARPAPAAPKPATSAPAAQKPNAWDSYNNSMSQDGGGSAAEFARADAATRSAPAPTPAARPAAARPMARPVGRPMPGRRV